MSIGLRIHVRGRVQGVFFRASTKQQAEKLNLTGYAKNLSNGDVEVVLYGESDNIDKMLAWLHHGPRLARVDKLTTQQTDFIETIGFSTQ